MHHRLGRRNSLEGHRFLAVMSRWLRGWEGLIIALLDLTILVSSRLVAIDYNGDLLVLMPVFFSGSRRGQS